MILTGALPPGQRVAEVKVVDAVGVSRTPLRLAMEKLEHEGLLARRASGGFTVREFTLRDVQQAIELRGSLEGTACRFAAEAREERDLTALHRIVADILVAGAFGHPRLQEFIFGGTTRTLLNADSPSLFLSH